MSSTTSTDHVPSITTVQQHIIQRQRSNAEATGEFSFLLSGITIATKVLASKVRRIGIEDLVGATGSVNVQGEQVQKLDMVANDMLLHCIGYRRSVHLMASEEEEDPVEVPETGETGKYIVLFDPLDGSSNIDVNIPVGTIFSVLRRPAGASSWSGGCNASEEILQAGYKQVAAGYVLYGSATVLIYTTGDGVHQFVLDPEVGAYVLVGEQLTIPKANKVYSCNEANSKSFPDGVQKYLDWAKTPDAGPYSSRYVGSFVADFHRILLKGGVFLYPSTAKAPNGKLRLMYECNPMAFLIEQAGGKATDGNGKRILEIEPTELHQRAPLVIGSPDEVDRIESFLK